ncbi:hypothetical protein A3760_27120 [Oleiphilus sp. HI0122]|nr:hypothetical protein A3760_27120 [Oleiphilus sp. HI0122]
METRQTNKESEETDADSTAPNNEIVQDEDADIQILEVLDSLHLEDNSSDNLDAEVESEEQTFDDIEYIE